VPPSLTVTVGAAGLIVKVALTVVLT